MYQLSCEGLFPVVICVCPSSQSRSAVDLTCLGEGGGAQFHVFYRVWAKLMDIVSHVHVWFGSYTCFFSILNFAILQIYTIDIQK